jgi:hypothetical protein
MLARIDRGDESRSSFIGSGSNDLEDWAKFEGRTWRRGGGGNLGKSATSRARPVRQDAYPTKIGLSRIVNEDRFTSVKACNA